MHRLQASLEDLLDHTSVPTWLMTPLWRVIYHEGVRANHLLFDPSDLNHFEASLFADESKVTEEQAQALEEIAFRLLCCAELKQMKDLIASLAFDLRRQVYVLYRRLLDLWRCDLRTALN